MSGWIDVQDRYPEPDGRPVLVWNGRWDRVAHFMSDAAGNLDFYTPHDDKLRGIIEWMPIPEHKAKEERGEV